ncbi:MAG: ParB/RepB/Spo0J family partition protein [Candidatus Cardinium sp.]|uniref:ParB/RepB/Spo0J family partition protein n=1 Tax=Cardinium endosymbiont of Dermatophagoides farinae TaxID=2597823 RepID=UPI001181E0EE|nr:ParB/RepB/Spo0J family partition protein [Cardinium endosymbiont of Dermatophagoides farinae]TSJ81416.1 ParB/RepB/Spo0J family partition protein [Cardinium endosymbiont of Dermatophagoides farinae]UWW97478.1 MAG: ParB/RepB/Spo0J family partition protein [Candidatus Cardinium sp.]
MQPTKGNRVLGRGLSALLQGPEGSADATDRFFKMINIASIAINPFQPRQDFNQETLNELSESIKLHGIIQPLTVRKVGHHTYQLIAGERRLRAAKLAGLEEVPTYIRTTDDLHMLEVALIENIQRESLNAIEIALSYQRLLTDCKLTQEALAERIGKDRTTVNNYLRLLKLPPDIQIALRDQKISMGHARALINLQTPEMQLSLLKKILEDALSVREVEKLVQDLSGANHLKKEAVKPQLNLSFKAKLKNTTTQLTRQFNTKVIIKADAQKQGEIKILFDSEEELGRIISIISNTK